MRISAILAAPSLFLLPAALQAQPSVLTWHNDNARTGQNLQETTLTPANVNASTFGKLFVIPVDGKVDAQPLYVPSVAIAGKGSHNVLYVVTEHDTAYAFDADNGSLLWQVSLLGASESTSDSLSCFQIVPEIGITSTPVIDSSSSTMYAVAMSKDSAGTYHQRIHALNLGNGAEQFGGPVEIQANYGGSGVEDPGGNQLFDARQHVERAALTLVNGVVYTAWSSHCDDPPYTSWIIGYNESNLQRTAVLNLTPNGNDGGIWQAGAGLAADGAGNLYVLMGNGSFDTNLNANGFPSSGDYGNGFVKLSTGGGQASVADYFMMANSVSESNADEDLGSGGPMILPTLTDSQGRARSLAVGAGKDGNIYVVDQASMGKFSASGNNIYQQMSSALTGVYSSPAWFNGTLYYGSEGHFLQAFPFVNGAFQGPSSQSAISFAFPGTTPSISANGASNGIVWATENSNNAVLHAYNAGNLGNELYNSNQASGGRDAFGTGNKFIVPTVVNGKVYVGTTSGVAVFGLLSSAGPAANVTSITSGTGSVTGAIAPGEIVTIWGSGLGPSSGATFSIDPGTGKLGTTLAGAMVSIGGFPAPILYASATQINAIVPYEIAGKASVTVQVTYQSSTSSGTIVPVQSAAPSIFTINQAGTGQAAAVNLDGSVNGPSHPVAPGGYLSIYLTGGGQTNPAGITGSISGTSFKYLVQQFSATVGGQPAQVTFQGAAPTYVDGLDQLNIQLSPDTPSGSQQILVFAGNASSSSAVTVTVQ